LTSTKLSSRQGSFYLNALKIAEYKTSFTETIMFVIILIPTLILFLTAALLPLALDTFSPNELSEMGIYMRSSEITSPLPSTNPCNNETACQLWNVTEQVAA
jgi:hypothetical protein